MIRLCVSSPDAAACVDSTTALRRVVSYLTESGLDEVDLGHVMVVVDELLTNLAAHGGTDGRTPEANLTTWIKGQRTERFVCLVLEDDGPPFDPTAFCPPPNTDDLDAMQPGGLGLPLIHGLSERVRYERRGGRNRVTILAPRRSLRRAA